MTDVRLQKRLAAEILGVGENRVKILPEALSEVSEALTKEDVRSLINEGKILVQSKRRNSRGRVNERRKARRLKGEGRRHGSRKGTRADERRMWITRIRKIREYLRYLRDSGVIDRRTYRDLYLHAKGGAFKSLSDLKFTLQQRGLLKA